MKNSCRNLPELLQPYIYEGKREDNQLVTLYMRSLYKATGIQEYFLYKSGKSPYMSWTSHYKMIHLLEYWVIVENLEGVRTNIPRCMVTKIDEMPPGIAMLWKLKEEG